MAARSHQPVAFAQDACGRNALRLATRGSTIIAELLRMSEHIPTAFTHPERSEYAPLIFDFVYFRQQELTDKVIGESPDLARLDEEFWQTHMGLLDRFFTLFRAIYAYAVELNRLVQEIDDGLYVTQSIETILANDDGAQILCELHHLYGVMLLLMDEKIGGKTRERLIVSYVRYRGAGGPQVVEVTDLCRATGYEPSPDADVEQRLRSVPNGYPVAYFGRVRVNQRVVKLLIQKLRSDDIYRRSSNYPLPEHRGVAMAAQGALLYTLLFFQPTTLSEESPVMMEIVNKHFSDNWVVNYYLGFTVDLTVAWEPFPAARSAIGRTIAVENVRYHQERIAADFKAASKQLTSVLRDGLLTESYVLANIFPALLPLTRQANVCLRWCILHGTRRQPQTLRRFTASYAAVRHGITDDDVIVLLMKTAQLEFRLYELFAELLSQKRQKWKQAKTSAAHKARRLSDYFAGGGSLANEYENTELQEWFTEVATRIESLSYKKPLRADEAKSTQPSDGVAAATRRRLEKLIGALESVQEFSSVNENLQVVQHVQEVHALLQTMLRYMNIERGVLDTLDIVSDFSYAWEQLAHKEYFLREIQGKIKGTPALSVQMRCVFVKLASLVELPCTRIEQACAADAQETADGPRRDKSRKIGARGNANPQLWQALETTSSYYSGVIVAFVRRVLHVLPTAIFETLRKVMQLLIVDKAFKECPGKIPRQEIKAMSQLPVRERLSTYTADIARYASGILAMHSMRIGVLEVDSRQLLEDGIRRELADQVARELHVGVQFDRSHPLTPAELEEELLQLGGRLGGIRAAFEYIQDYVDVQGLRIWTEELTRIVNFNVDMEANAFVRKKILPWESVFQSDSAPIPFFEFGVSTGLTRLARTRDSGAEASTHAAVVTPAPGFNYGQAYGFLGRFTQHVLSLTNPQTATYLSSMGSWYARDTATEVVGPRTFSGVGTALGPAGLHALDRLLCFIIAKNIRLVLCTIRQSITQGSAPSEGDAPTPTSSGAEPPPTDSAAAGATRDAKVKTVQAIAAVLCSRVGASPAGASEQILQAYTSLVEVLGTSSFSPVTDALTRVGRLQLMRKMLCSELRSCGKLDSGCLFASLRTANEALLGLLGSDLWDVDAAPAQDSATQFQRSSGEADRRGKNATSDTTEVQRVLLAVVGELSPLIEAVGLTDVQRQLFLEPCKAAPIPFLVCYLLALTLRQATRMVYDERVASCTPARDDDSIDPNAFIAGLALLLQQFHASQTDVFVSSVAQAVCVTVRAFADRDASDPARQANDVLPARARTLSFVLRFFLQCVGRPEDELRRLVPPTLFADYRARSGAGEG